MSVAVVWNWQSFATAVAFGLAFGYFVGTWVARRRARAEAWRAGLFLAAFVMGLALSQVVAALWVGDEDWVRIVSRTFIQIAAAAAAGLGTWLRLR